MATEPEAALRVAAVEPSPSVARAPKRRRPSGEPPPLPHKLNRSGTWWLVLAASVVAFWLLLALNDALALELAVREHSILFWLADLRTDGLTDFMQAIGSLASPWPLRILWWSTLLVLIATRRWRHLLVYVLATVSVTLVASVAADVIQRPRPLGVDIIGPWQGFAMPSRPLAVLSALLVGVLYTLVPQGRGRNRGKLAAALLIGLVAFSRLYRAQDNITDAAFGIIIGVAIMLIAFRLFVPAEIFPVTYHRGRTAHLDVEGARGVAIRRALTDQLGVVPLAVTPFGLTGSGGSTPLRVTVKGDPNRYLFCKLYAATHLRADRWYKLGRTLMYGRLEDESAYRSVRQLVQYEDYALRLLRDGGLPVPQPLGVVEITPEREYLNCMEFFDRAQEIGDAPVDDSIIDQGLDLVRRLWDAGLAHRDIKPANLLVRDGQLLLIDSAFAQVRPSPWRQAVDLGNMMLVLALRTDPRRVYDRARVRFTEEEIAEAFAATRGLTMPSQLRRMIRDQGRDLHAEFTGMLSRPMRPISIQRWSARRVGLWALVLLVAAIALAMVLSLLGGPL